MDLENYKKFILKLKKIKKTLWINKHFPDLNLPVIVFGWYWEPLLHAKVFDYISYAKKHWFATEMISNGYLLTENNCEKIIASGLDRLAISLHTLNPDINQKIMWLPNAIPTIQNALRYLDDKNIDIEIRRVSNFDGKLFDPSEKNYIYDRFLSDFSKHIQVFGPTPAWNRGGQFTTNFYEKMKDSDAIPCQTSYFTLNISFDGDFLLCCCDFSKKDVILAKNWDFNLKEIQKKITDFQSNLPDMCVNCRKAKNTYYDDVIFPNYSNGDGEIRTRV